MSQITPTFLLLSLALLVWSASVGISNYLAQDFAREHAHGTGSTSSASAMEAIPELAPLREAHTADPSAVEPALNLARGLMHEAFRTSNGGLLMEAVKTYSGILEHHPEHPDALLGLSRLCLDAGILDKALDFYQRYLKVRPDDLQAKTDFALAQLRAGQSEEGVTTLREVLNQEPAHFPARMTLAIAMRESGDIASAENHAEKAKALAPDEATATRVDEFIRSLDSAGTEAYSGQGAQAISEEKSDISVAAQVQQYFERHEIIGPKLAGVIWPSPDLAQVQVRDFPVSQMPPFAKVIFQQKVGAFLASLPESVRIELVDADNREVLLAVAPEAEANE